MEFDIKKHKYQWSQTWPDRFAHTDINKAIEEIEIIVETNGEITPELLVQSAKNNNSFFHNYFEWDDKKAADKYRIFRAKELLRRIEVNVVTDGEPRYIRVYETVKKGNETEEHKYTRFDTSTEDIIVAVQTRCINDLLKVKNRISGHSLNNHEQCCKLIDKLIELLENKPEVKALPVPKLFEAV